MKALVIDPKIAGIAGDMLFASLLDLSASIDIIDPLADAINRLGHCRRFTCTPETVDGGGITAIRLAISIEERRSGDGDALRDSYLEVADAVGLSRRGRDRGISVLEDLLAAERAIHRSGFHLHEIASVDTIFDIVGSLFVLEEHGFLDGLICSTPPALGGGTIAIEHGEVANPAPATLEVLCRHRIPCTSVPVEMELTTPTGAAMLAAIAAEFTDPYPSMTPVRVGYGAGTRPVPGRPNVLRVVEGEVDHAFRRRVAMLETNLDDVSGETIAYTLERLMEAGAIDVFVTQAIGKKNRPVNIVSAMVEREDVDRMVSLLMEETGTLGVRIAEVSKVVAHRSREPVPVTLEGRTFPVRIKTSRRDGTVIASKPEYDDLAAIARELRLPLREVQAAVRRQCGLDTASKE